MTGDDYRARLIAAREKLGLSVLDMALLMHTPLSTYKQWEDGARRTPGVAVVAAKYLLALQPRTPHILAALMHGMSPMEVARAAGASRANVYRLAERHGIGLSKPERLRATPASDAKMAALVRDGHSIRQAGRILGLTDWAANTAGRRLGLTAIARNGRRKGRHEDAVVAALRAGERPTRVAARYGLHPTSISRIARKHGLARRTDRAPE